MASEESAHLGKRKAEETEEPAYRNVRSCPSASAQAEAEVDWQSSLKTVSERNHHMFNNPEMSDISFTCKDSDKTFYAHKYVLATSSGVFHAMFYGPLAEKNSVVHLSDTDEKGLEELLRFLYTDECHNLAPDNIFSVLYLSKKYMVPSLAEYLIMQLTKDVIEPDNVLDILEQAIECDEKEAEEKCWQFIELRANEVFALETFNNISQGTLAKLLKRDILNASETELFEAVLKWSEFQCSQNSLDLTTENRRSALGEAVYDLRLLHMDLEVFAKLVSRSGLLFAEELVPIYEELSGTESPSLKWTLPKRELIPPFDTTKREIRIARFSETSESFTWEDKNTSDHLAFSIDGYAAYTYFLGVRLFGEVNYKVTLLINDQRQSVSKCNSRNEDGGGMFSNRSFDVILKSPVLIKKDEVVKMEAKVDGAAYTSWFGWRGKSKVEVGGITVTFIDSVGNGRTCVSQGQFKELILSV